MQSGQFWPQPVWHWDHPELHCSTLTGPDFLRIQIAWNPSSDLWKSWESRTTEVGHRPAFPTRNQNILKCKRSKASQIHKIDHFYLAFQHFFFLHALNSKNTFKQWLTKGSINYPLLVALYRKILEEVDNHAFNARQNGVQQITQWHALSNSDKKKHFIKLLFSNLFLYMLKAQTSYRKKSNYAIM